MDFLHLPVTAEKKAEQEEKLLDEIAKRGIDFVVKLIGATAHYVTADLDEGLIIEQSVERVDHRNSPVEIAAVGRDIERIALARAVRWQAEHRILLNDGSTVVFR